MNIKVSRFSLFHKSKRITHSLAKPSHTFSQLPFSHNASQFHSLSPSFTFNLYPIPRHPFPLRFSPWFPFPSALPPSLSTQYHQMKRNTVT